MAIELKSFLQKTTLLHPTDLDLAEDKSCPVCLEPYFQSPSIESPRRLPCGHVLGTECLLIWAAQHANTEEGFKCPWCRRLVIESDRERAGDLDIDVGGRNVRGPAMRFLRWVGDGMGVDDGIWAVAQHWLGLLRFQVFGVAALAAYYFSYDKNPWVALPSLVALSLALSSVDDAAVVPDHRRINVVARRRFLGALLMLLGLCVGMAGDRWLGHTLLVVGRKPYDKTIIKAYGEHKWKVLLGAVVVLGVLAAVPLPGRRMIALEATAHIVRCLMNPIVPGGMR